MAKKKDRAFAEAIAASRLRCKDRLIAAVKQEPGVVQQQDGDGRTCVHFAAEHCEGLEEILAAEGVPFDLCLPDRHGEVALHFAAVASCPMAAYALAKACPASCLVANRGGKTACDIAKEKNFLEVLNAMLLACCSEEANPRDSSQQALEAIRMLLEAGAVPDTWAPNGNSALMMAASANSPRTIAMLLEKNAQINMKDTLGRTALMFAAGNNAKEALVALMDAGGQQALSLQDNRGNNVLKYALEACEVKTLLETRFAELEDAANANQAALLASLEAEEISAAAAKTKRAHRGKKKKGSKAPTVEPLATIPVRGAESPKPFQDSPPRRSPGDAEPHSCKAWSLPDGVSGAAAVVRPGGGGGGGHAEDAGKDGAVEEVADKARLWLTVLGDGSVRCRISRREEAGKSGKEARLGPSLEPSVIHLDAQATPMPEKAGAADNAGHLRKSAREHASSFDCEAVDVVPMSLADGMAIQAALCADTPCASEAEQIWQEVKKSGKGTSKPPRGRRSEDKFFDASSSLFPSSSSASLESLGESTLSAASARSMAQSLRHTPLHQGSKPIDMPPPPPPPRRAQAASPAAHSPTPQLQSASAPKPTCSTAAANLSWANVVQGSIFNSISSPELVTMEGAGGDTQTPGGKAGSDGGAQNPPATVGVDLCSEGRTSDAASVADAPATSSGALPPAQHAADPEGPDMERLRRENEALRLQLQGVERQRGRLEAVLSGKQHEHRLVLQKAVEDTARNILAQEKQRYSSQIEALQLLLLQTHHQLTTLQQWQRHPQHWGGAPSHPSPLQAQKPGPRGQHQPWEAAGGTLAGSNPTPLPKQQSPSSAGSKDNLFGSPPAARLHSVSPKAAERATTMRNAHGPSNPTTCFSTSDAQHPMKGRGLFGETDDRPQPAASKPIPINAAERAGTGSGHSSLQEAASAGTSQGGSLPSNPWATSEGQQASGVDARAGAKSLLPWMNSIWGAPPSKTQQETPPAESTGWKAASAKLRSASSGGYLLSDSLAGESAGGSGTAFLTPASVAGN